MRQVILVFAVLAVVAIGVIAFTGSDGTRVRARPVMGVVHGPSGVVYQVKDDDYRIVVSLPKDWTVQSQANSGGSNVYSASAVFANRLGSLSATVQRNSYSPSIISINGVSYDLSQGSVFRIRAAKSPAKADNDSKTDEPATPDAIPQSPTVEVIQFPFAPLNVTPNCVEELNKYFTERGYD